MSILDGLVQPDARSCGAACLVAFRAIRDPSYAASLRAGPAVWAGEVLHTHHEVTRLRDEAATGAAMPWPRALGTPPWAVARRLQAVTGEPWRGQWLRWGERSRAVDEICRTVRGGSPVPLYLGSRWLPRHVVLVVEADGTRLHVYDPARGRVLAVGADELAPGPVRTLGWSVLWSAVLPG